MRIAWSVDGGFAVFPGLAGPFALDTGTLPPDDAARVAALVDAARFFDRPSPSPAPPSGCDARRYRVTIDDGVRHRTLEFADDGGDDSGDDSGAAAAAASLHALLDLLRSLRRR